MESDFSVDYAASVDINIIFHFIIGPAVSGNFKNRHAREAGGRTYSGHKTNNLRPGLPPGW